MRIDFTKMHGAGNDFVMIDNINARVRLSPGDVAKLCHRRFGIGADGVLLLEPPDSNRVDATMVYYNADGSRAEMCGNGARCFAAFALERGLGRDGLIRFNTDAGIVSAETVDDLYRIELTPPTDLNLGRTIELRSGPRTIHTVNTGVPHVVHFVDDVNAVDIRRFGSEIRHHADFAPAGTNVNVAAIDEDGLVHVRTYERGVEDETLACGTGVTAVGIVSSLINRIARPVRLQVAGASVLLVDFEETASGIEKVTLTGPAATVFTGMVEIGD
ncbi:MAG: diaminopimelate epimerase [Verrucomicrobia bacterium]|nr:MAG: diaminopimelate epimerase [Verrucomicrobiota bacterium]